MTLAIDARAAGELRVLRLRDFLIERHRAAWSPMMWRRYRADLIGGLVSGAGILLFTLGFGGALLLVTVRSIQGGASIGSVVLVLSAGQQLHNQVAGVVSTSWDLFRVTTLMREYAWLARYVRANEDRGTKAGPSELRDGIRLERVSFRYPATVDDAVRDVSLHLPAGAVVAVVGENGAGKSTLVKLMCGLIAPSSGRILVDGAPLTDLHGARWRRALSGAFQDFVRFELLARESVGTGAVEHIEDEHIVRSALRRADVAELERDLPQGLETPLGRAFLKGIDLSGGEWQKVALGRAMMREGPLVLVLDEPTYSLDVESERRVFDWFARVAATENERGTITVIVSHRFSTVRTANLIAVMHQGRLVEWGTHADLMARGGDYAVMYRMQAEGYR
jgi:ATP-binding cassette subfamily B protein